MCVCVCVWLQTCSKHSQGNICRFPLKAVVSHTGVCPSVREIGLGKHEFQGLPPSSDPQVSNWRQLLWRSGLVSVGNCSDIIFTLGDVVSQVTVVLPGRSVSTRQWSVTFVASSAASRVGLTSTISSVCVCVCVCMCVCGVCVTRERHLSWSYYTTHPPLYGA